LYYIAGFFIEYGDIMQTGKISQRIKAYMDKRNMDLAGLADQTGLSAHFLETMLTKEVYPPLGR
jgi:lambda repressor-like predicted transcriptional regulator